MFYGRVTASRSASWNQLAESIQSVEFIELPNPLEGCQTLYHLIRFWNRRWGSTTRPILFGRCNGTGSVPVSRLLNLFDLLLEVTVRRRRIRSIWKSTVPCLQRQRRRRRRTACAPSHWPLTTGWVKKTSTERHRSVHQVSFHHHQVAIEFNFISHHLRRLTVTDDVAIKIAIRIGTALARMLCKWMKFATVTVNRAIRTEQLKPTSSSVCN